MKVSGFSFIRNAQKYDFPIFEAINSILPICDDFYIAVGKSEDNTLELIKKIAPDKIKIIETVWDDSLREGGKVLAVETNKAFQAIAKDSDWAFYIQGDEVVHEKYLPEIKRQMELWKDDKSVDGLLFKYLHFYGSYDYVGSSAQWYPNEIRIVKNNKKIYSYRDAQGFRKNENEKLNVKPIEAYMYHYGWVKHPDKQKEKIDHSIKFWKSDEGYAKVKDKINDFDYSEIDMLSLFNETHPKTMQDLIARKNWIFDYDISRNKLSLKNKFKNFVKKYLGIEIGYKNYKII
ncbi:MAG: glycosyltransferase family 2 protein [Bacteroidetes bacterium]|nr:MAG: glycosyltransferase family 2 protein [Bacteroidota bacterium]